MEKYSWGEDKFFQYWEKGQREIKGFSPLLTIGSLKYYMEYFKDKGFEKNLCHVFVENNELIGLTPILVFLDENKKRCISGGGGEFLKGPFIANDISHNLRKSFYKEYLHIMSYTFSSYKINYAKLILDPCHLISGSQYFHPFQIYFNDISIINFNIIDLRIEINQIWNNIRKSYRSLIKKAQKKYNQKIVDKKNVNQTDFEKYRLLHAIAADRVTRSQETFQRMYSMIKTGESILILTETNDEALAAHLFFLSGTVAYYASSAIKRGISNSMGVGHLGIWTGIKYLSENNIQFIDMSVCEKYGSDIDDKVKDINFFKKGYGGSDVSLFGMKCKLG